MKKGVKCPPFSNCPLHFFVHRRGVKWAGGKNDPKIGVLSPLKRFTEESAIFAPHRAPLGNLYLLHKLLSITTLHHPTPPPPFTALFVK